MARILLVDDDEEVGRVLEDALLGARHEVDRVYAAAGARSHLESRSYDLVIADARLPDGTGMTVADRAAAKGAKALIITGFAFMYPELSRYDVLLKPVRPDEILNEVARRVG